MILHEEMTRSIVIFLGLHFATDDEAYNFYNAYARNRGFAVRKKIDKSQRPPHDVVCG